MSKLLVALTILGCFAAVSPAQFVDTKTDANIEEISELVCKTTTGTKSLLSKFSTIERLVDYLGGLTSDHKLYGCRTQHLDSLEQLVQVVKTASGDVCGEQKLALIEDFHRKYVSKVSKHLKEQKLTGKAPKMIKLFFIQYATEVSSICEQSAIKVLADYKHAISAEEVHKVDELRKFTDTLGMTDLKRGYKRIYLFWNLIESLALAEDEKFSQYLSESGDVRLSVQMKDASPINAIQILCRRQLKPVYGKSILPVLRLVDMGYYPQAGQLLDDLSNDPNTKTAFYVAQMCETMIPVATYSDDKLGTDEFVAITKKEASKLTLPKMEKLEQIEERSIQVEPSSFNADQLVLQPADIDTLKQNVAHRGKILNSMLKQIVSKLQSKLVKMLKIKGFKLFKRNQNKQLEVVDVPVERMNELQVEVEPEDGLMRRKRGGFWASVVGLMMGTGCVIYLIALYIVKFVVFFIPGLISYLLACLGLKPARYFMRYLWYFGTPWARSWKEMFGPQDRK